MWPSDDPMRPHAAATMAVAKPSTIKRSGIAPGRNRRTIARGPGDRADIDAGDGCDMRRRSTAGASTAPEAGFAWKSTFHARR